MKSNYEILKENEQRRIVLSQLLADIKGHPFLVFAKRPLREAEYYDSVINNTKKAMGAIPFVDTPLDLGLKETVLKLIQDELSKLQDQFDSYTIKK